MEREIYAAKDAATHNQAVAAKAAVRKQQGLYGEALAELGRIYTYALMGDELAERKKFIVENGYRYLADADI